MTAPYIPPQDAAYDAFLTNFSTLIAAGPTTYGLVAGDSTAITASRNAWHAAYLLATNPTTRTAPTVANKDAERSASEAVVRPYAQTISHNSGISPALILGLGLNLPNPTRPPIPPPLTVPTLAWVGSSHLVHTLAYKDTSLGMSKAKPVGAIGVEIWRGIGTVPATDPAQCVYYQQWTKSPNTSQFEPGDLSKFCTYFARWITRSGPAGTAQPGPWSSPLTVVIA